MNLKPGAHLPGGPLSGWQLSAAFLPFGLALLYPQRLFTFASSFSIKIGSQLMAAFSFALLGVLLALCIAGLVRQLPLWALPGLGMGFFIVSAFVQLMVQGLVFISAMLPLYGGWPEDLGQKIWSMLLVQGLYLGCMVVVVAGLLSLLPGFYQRVRQEWTLLSFLLYGIAILPVLGNDAFHSVERYQTASLLVLALGAGLYLVAPRRWQRVCALLGPAVLSPVIMSVGLYQVFPAQPWANQVASFRLWEALQPVLYLAPLPVLLLLAALVPRLPWGARGEPAASPGGAA